MLPTNEPVVEKVPLWLRTYRWLKRLGLFIAMNIKTSIGNGFDKINQSSKFSKSINFIKTHKYLVLGIIAICIGASILISPMITAVMVGSAFVVFNLPTIILLELAFVSSALFFIKHFFGNKSYFNKIKGEHLNTKECKLENTSSEEEKKMLSSAFDFAKNLSGDASKIKKLARDGLEKTKSATVSTWSKVMQILPGGNTEVPKTQTEKDYELLRVLSEKYRYQCEFHKKIQTNLCREMQKIVDSYSLLKKEKLQKEHKIENIGQSNLNHHLEAENEEIRKIFDKFSITHLDMSYLSSSYLKKPQNRETAIKRLIYVIDELEKINLDMQSFMDFYMDGLWKKFEDKKIKILAPRSSEYVFQK